MTKAPKGIPRHFFWMCYESVIGMHVLVRHQCNAWLDFIKSYPFFSCNNTYEIAIGWEKSPHVHEFVNIKDIFAKPPDVVTTMTHRRTKESIDKDFHGWMQYVDDNHMVWQFTLITILNDD